MEYLDPNGSDIDVLSQDEGYLVWTDRADVQMGKMKSGTINAYLGTYEKFLQFAIEDRVRATVPEIADDVRRVFANTIPKLKGWRRTVDLDLRPQRTQRILDVCDNRLTNEDVDAFHKSKHVHNTKMLFQKAVNARSVKRGTTSSL